jgi:class 3 adenylate cyclase/tetratricopeptide (TPR) repeat protein
MPKSDQSLSERRYLTIVFVDLVNYTHLAEALDPEDLHVIQRRYQNLGLLVMGRFGGFVARFTGDGILVYFGYPTAHENDAERAVRASLELIAKLQTLDTQLSDATLPPLQARIGIHTGLVLIAPDLAGEGPAGHYVFGEVINIAARLQAEAPSNGIVISQDTLNLIAGQFECVSLGARPIKGLSRDIALYQVSRLVPDAPRSAPRFARGAASMVGREAAMAGILDCWNIVRNERRSRIVAVVGEAGVGKTRLITELTSRPELADASILQVNCHEIFVSTPLYPVGSYLWARIGLTVDDNVDSQQQKIATFLCEYAMDSPENREIVASLLGLAVGGIVAAAAPTSLQFKRKQYEFVSSWMQQAFHSRLIVLWIEDAHWLDPSSAELLREIVAAARGAPFLLLLTRRSFPAGPALPEADETILLEQLNNRACNEIARAIPGADLLTDATISRAIAAAEGMPLFLEQFIISLIEEKRQAPVAGRKGGSVPLMLAEMMSERLDRRPGGRRIVQAAACIGRSFTPDFLSTVLQQDVAQAEAPLQSLVDAELLLPRRYGAEIRYEFRHALLQRIAYESVVQADRRAMHERIVDVLQSTEPSNRTPPEVIAHHLTEAGHVERAVRAWLHAGTSAAGRSAHIEAIEHLRRGLALLQKLPENETLRRDLELNIQAALMASTLTTEGATSSRVSECCQRGLELCRQGEPSPLVLAFAYGQFTYANCKGDIDESEKLARLFLSLAEQNGSRLARAMGLLMLGRVMLGLSRLAEALEHLHPALELCASCGEGTGTLMFGQHVDVHVKAVICLVRAARGEVDAAIEFGVDALRTAARYRYPHTSAIPLAFLGTAFSVLDANDQAVRGSERLLALAEEHQLTSFHAIGSAQLGVALCRRGDLIAAVSTLENAVASLGKIGFRLALAVYVGRLAEAQFRLGRLDSAEQTCARALDIIHEGSTEWFRPEVLRIEALIAAARAPQQPERPASMLRRAAAFAHELGLPGIERWCLLSLQDHLGPDARDADAATRLAELSYLNDSADRVAMAMRDEL